ncbi:class I SAM-dependent methyltransferase [Alkalicoccus chagannorensis]|uniref:class I SAM-dependent methyltransferase n=1 Tax=Alkalicoccus chagannorensis TaxID=427072 RepID=UPI0004008EF1|nr:class I SAM-dependent methyltransferase [Alkalicoccus chagannorensis]
MPEREEKLAASLTGTTPEIIPYLPYLLQDLWYLGSSPADMAELIRTYTDLGTDAEVLDLACGKGAPAVELASAFHFSVKGIDLMEAFIEEARQAAEDAGVSHLCTFVHGDAEEEVRREVPHDLVLFGAAGDVLGDRAAMLKKLSNVMKPGGWLIIDDVYSEPGASEGLPKREWERLMQEHGLSLVAEKLVDEASLQRELQEQLTRISRRAEELSQQEPEKRPLFEEYVASQRAEGEALEHEWTGVTMLLKKR